MFRTQFQLLDGHNKETICNSPVPRSNRLDRYNNVYFGNNF